MSDMMLSPQDPGVLELLNNPELQQMLQNELEEQRKHTASFTKIPLRQLKMPNKGELTFAFKVNPNMAFNLTHFIGHVVHVQYFRQYWQNNVVVCQSDNSECARPSGVLYPNRRCIECPDGQFTTGVDGKSVKPKCANKNRFYIIPCQFNPKDRASYAFNYPVDATGGQIMTDADAEPIFLEVPPTSLKSVKQYFEACEQFGQSPMPYSTFITLFSLTEASGPSGAYAKLDIKPLKVVSPHMLKYRN